MRKSFHYYEKMGLSSNDIEAFDLIINEIKCGYFNHKHIRLLNTEKALKYLIAEGEYGAFIAAIRSFSYISDDGVVRRRYLVDPFSSNIVEFIQSAFPIYTEAVYAARNAKFKADPETVIANSLIINDNDKQYLLDAIYNSYPKKDVDKSIIGDVLARQISGWRYPIRSEKDVIRYSEISNLYPSLELYNKNIMTTYNDTTGCYNDYNVPESFVEIRINYDTLDEENKLYADLLEKTGKAKFILEVTGKDLSIFVPCRRDEFVLDVSNRMSSLLAGFKKQDMIYGKITIEEVAKEINYLLPYYDEESKRIIKEMCTSKQYNELFKYLGISFYYDDKEKQFWLDKVFYDKHVEYINSQRTIDVHAKLEKKINTEA